MFSRFMPKEFGFFDMFNNIGKLTLAAAKVFQTLLAEPLQRESHARKLKELENQADSVTHTTVEMLRKTFITPLDRDDIHKLITKLDDILDLIDACGQRIYLYDIGEAPANLVRLAEVNCRAVEKVNEAVSYLQNIKSPKLIQATCVQINDCENEADQILRLELATLLKEENDIRRLIKLKEIYELMEAVTDRCEDVAHVLEAIVIDYA